MKKNPRIFLIRYKNNNKTRIVVGLSAVKNMLNYIAKKPISLSNILIFELSYELTNVKDNFIEQYESERTNTTSYRLRSKS